MIKSRYYEVQPGRVVVPPKEDMVGPGVTNMRFLEGETLEWPEGRKLSRFMRGRIAAGDLVEVKTAKPPRAKTKKPPAPASELNLAAGFGKKEG